MQSRSLHWRVAAVGAALGLVRCSVLAQDFASARACVSIQDAQARLACYDLAMARSPGGHTANASTAGAPQPGSTAGVVASGADSAFGLPAPMQAPQANSVSSQIAGAFEGWQATTRWTLANGHVWAIADGSSSAYPRRTDAKVRVTRGSFGSYFIEIEGVSQSPRVRRLQ